MDVRVCDDRERAVVDLWRRGHLSWSTIQVYLHWVRRFKAYCDRRELIDTDQLSLSGALRFARNYAGPRLKGRRSARGSRESARSAIQAWACITIFGRTCARVERQARAAAITFFAERVLRVSPSAR